MHICKCLRCGWDWLSRKITPPERCAHCGAKYWDRPKRIKRIAPDLGPVGRPHKYPVHLLNVGQHMTIDHTANTLSARQAIAAYGKRSGRVFNIKAGPAGIRVTRAV